MELRKPLEQYKGLLCGCAPGTHAALVTLLRSHTKSRQGVLDIGTHAGAMLQRLADEGYTDLTGTDLDPTRFNVSSATFKRLELNAPFSREFDRKFDLITCTDVMEHLDSPRQFLAECRRLLNEDGILAISVPNIAFWEGRLKFLLRGEQWGFGDRNYRTQRHISPSTFEQLSLLMQEVGYELLEVSTGGSFATTLRRIITAPLWIPLRLIGGPTTMGECALFVARKAAPVADLRSPTHYRERWAGRADRIGYA